MNNSRSRAAPSVHRSHTHQIPLVNTPPKIFVSKNKATADKFAEEPTQISDLNTRRSQSLSKSLYNDFDPFLFKLNSLSHAEFQTKSSMKSQSRFSPAPKRDSSLDSIMGPRKKEGVHFSENQHIHIVDNWKLQNLSSDRRLLQLQQRHEGCAIF